MARFTVRVELHSGNANDYEVLHSAMENAGFSRYITSDGGVTYHLPWAEYNFEGPAPIDQVLAAAKRAAGTTRRSGSILVTESERRQWDGLIPVRPLAPTR